MAGLTRIANLEAEVSNLKGILENFDEVKKAKAKAEAEAIKEQRAKKKAEEEAARKAELDAKIKAAEDAKAKAEKAAREAKEAMKAVAGLKSDNKE
jgi:colicin import membrane protein